MINLRKPSLIIGLVLGAIHLYFSLNLLVYYPYSNNENFLIFYLIDMPISLILLLIQATRIPLSISLHFNNEILTPWYFIIIGTLWYFFLPIIIAKLRSRGIRSK